MISKSMVRNIAAIAAFTLGAGSCARETPATPAHTPSPAVEAARTKANTAVWEAVVAQREYKYAEKREFLAIRGAELATLQAELERLTLQADRATGEVKEAARSTLDAVRIKWVESKKRLDLAEQSTEESWAETKAGFADSFAAVRDSLIETRKWASEKLAP